MIPLAGKVILVTGAARRIGRAIALELSRQGARVLIHYGESEEDAVATARDCHDAPLYQANLESVSEIRAMYNRIETQQGRLDGLVNNAARFTYFDVMDIEEADWDSIHSINLKATFFSCQAAARLMRRHGGGRIVNISSLGGLRPWAHHVHYCASKAGVIMLTKALSKALAPDISVNSVAPGVFPFNGPEAHSPRVAAMIARTPARRAGEAAELVDAVCFFLSSPGFVTGQIMAVDGGLSLS